MSKANAEDFRPAEGPDKDLKKGRALSGYRPDKSSLERDRDFSDFVTTDSCVNNSLLIAAAKPPKALITK
jgi:hypothetical protein